MRLNEANRPAVTEDFIEWFLDGCEDHRVMHALAAMGLRSRMQPLTIEELRAEFHDFGFPDEEVSDE
jgi:hypothetical protein